MDTFGLSPYEWRTLQFSVLWTFEAVAASDDKIDKTERRTLAEAVARPRPKACPFVQKIWSSLHQDFDKLQEDYLADERELRQGLTQTMTLLKQRATPSDGKEFRASLLRLGREIAACSGGFLGFGEMVSDKEKATLRKLEAILELSPPAPPKA